MKKQGSVERDAKARKKRRMLFSIVLLAVLAAVSCVLLENPQIFEKNEPKPVTSMYSDQLYSYVFYPTDYDLDVTKDDWYMQLDRSLHYKKGNVSVMVTEEELPDYSAAVRFFDTYFKTIIAGDADTYNTYFTDRYYEYYEPYDRFAPQMLYDIEIEELSETARNDGSMAWTFNVKYRIHRNDGTFRNDLDSDSSKKLYFELLGDSSGQVKIDYITYYRR